MKTLPSNSAEIKELIPQRAPFVLVDRILDFQEKEITAGFNIPDDHVLLQDDGCLSEAGIIEHFAQSIALHQGYSNYIKDLPAPVGYIGSIKNMEIYKLPSKNQLLVTQIQLVSQMLGVTMVKGEVTLAGEVIAIGEMRTVIVDELKKSGLQSS